MEHKVEIVINNFTLLVDMGPVYACAGMISGVAFARTQYSNVLDNEYFHMLYDVKERPLKYIHAGQEIQMSIASAPCVTCGLILPLRNLTVDHQRPQSIGETEAVLKTFRAFGLTKEGPKGPKGQAILAHWTQGIPLKPALTQPGRAVLGGTSVNDRYTLNELGTIIYSFIAGAGKTAALKSSCMHGLLNLRPVSQTCNSSLGNRQVKFPPVS